MRNLIFDIGANRGEYTESARRLFPSAKFVCVEPNPSLFEKLKSKNDTETVTIYNAACSDSDGFIEFYECQQDDSISTVSKIFLEKSCFTTSEKLMRNGRKFKDHYSYNSPIKVKTITLDSIIDSHGIPDLIKIDVEGHELEVLKGLSSKVPLITFEWHEDFKERVIEAVTHLSNIGFTQFSTEIWKVSADYHDKEPDDNCYMSFLDFVSFYSDSLSIVEDEKTRHYVTRSGMVWAK